MKEFPGLVELHEKHGEDVAAVSLSVDLYEGGTIDDELKGTVLKFLREEKAAFDNVLSKTPDLEVLKALGGAAIPIVDVYDRTGKLAKRFTSEDGKHFTYQKDVIPFVESLIKKKGE